jgi:hypothetical protein
LPDPGPHDARDRHPRGRVRLLDLFDRHGRHLAIRYWFTLTRSLVRARWQDRKVESNEQADWSEGCSGVRETSQYEIRVRVE